MDSNRNAFFLCYLNNCVWSCFTDPQLNRLESDYRTRRFLPAFAIHSLGSVTMFWSNCLIVSSSDDQSLACCGADHVQKSAIGTSISQLPGCGRDVSWPECQQHSTQSPTKPASSCKVLNCIQKPVNHSGFREGLCCFCEAHTYFKKIDWVVEGWSLERD